MIGHLQQSFGIKLQWDKNTSNPVPPAPANSQQERDVRPLGGSASRRRLRHVSQLALRGLDISAAVAQAGYVLELAAEGVAHVLERSDAFRTSNPTWEPACGIGRGRDLSTFELRAVAPGASGSTFWRATVNLLELEALPCRDLEQLRGPSMHVMPFVQLGSQWFAFPATRPAGLQPAEPSRSRAGSVKQIFTSEICSAGDHISAMISRLQGLRARSVALREAIGKPLKECHAQSAKRNRRLQCSQSLTSLRHEVTQRQEHLRHLRSQLGSARRMRAVSTIDGSDTDRNPSSKDAEEPRSQECTNYDCSGRPGVAWLCPTVPDKLQSLWLQLRCRQMRMLHEICQVYPIENHGRFWTIRGFSVAGIETLSRQDLREKDNISTALGFLAHLLVTISGVLEVPLRVDVREAGSSRTCISDLHEAVPRSGAPAPWQWPLYYGQGLERPRFERALRLLRDGLHQFLYSRGHLDERCVRSNNLLECAEIILRRELFGPDAL